MRRRLNALLSKLLVLLTFSCLGTAQATENSNLPVVQLRAGLYLIQAEIAQKPADLQRGLMHRTELPPQNGMLFVFPHKRQQCMWMMNTLIPLSVAFLRDDGTIVNIETMQPQTQTSHCSAEPVRLALEMNAGWFEQRNLGPGSVLRNLPPLP